MPAGFQLDGINFTDDALQQHPKHAALLGEIVTSFSLLEGTVGGIYGLLLHQDIETALESLQALPTNWERVQAVRSEVASNAELRGDPKIDELMKSILQFAEKRNKIAHGVWGTNPVAASIIYRLPVKKWINFLAPLVAHGTEGNAIEQVDELKAFIEEYNLSDLQDLKSEGSALLEAAMLLFRKLAINAAKSDGWTE